MNQIQGAAEYNVGQMKRLQEKEKELREAIGEGSARQQDAGDMNESAEGSLNSSSGTCPVCAPAPLLG